MRHWTLARDAEASRALTLDREGASTNTLGAEVLAEFNEALDQLDRDPPRGLVIASGKASGFIAGADVDEFKAIGDEAAALAHRAARLGHVRAPRGVELSDASRSSAAFAWAAGSSSRSRAAIASSSTSPARGSACPKSCSGSCPAGAG